MDKLTKAGLELLRVMRIGPRDSITDKRTANALSLRGYVTYDAGTDTWTITDAGRQALAEATATAPMAREG